MATAKPPSDPKLLPTHLDLPDSDGEIVENGQESAQSFLLTGSILPHLVDFFPDEQFFIGQDNGIYWKITDPPLRGVKSPDWYLVVGVPPLLDGIIRRSYVLWQEKVTPTILLEYASGDGSKERDDRPMKGKFWVYERRIKAPYYGIFEADYPRIDMYRMVDGRYRPMAANDSGRYAIPEMGVELGLWHGSSSHLDGQWWMRWWKDGAMLLSGDEREARAMLLKDAERRRADEETRRADSERARAERLAEKLRALGLDPDDV